MLRAILLALLVGGAGACGLFEDLRPVDAHVSLDGEPGVRVQLVTSSRFVSAVSETGVTRVTVITSDTTYPALPFDQTYRIASDQRFLAELSRLDTDLDSVNMRVFVNGDRKFNEGGALISGARYLFVYTFNRPITSEVDVVF